MNKIKETIQWWQSFENQDIVIQTETHLFDMKIDKRQLPHLLGLHYSTKDNLKGLTLLKYVQKMSDEELLAKVHEYYPNQHERVKERIHYFKYFMEHLEEAILVESTNPNTKLKSEFLLVRSEDHKVLHLGIGTNAHEDYFETFIVTENNFYFKESTIHETILSIQKWEQDQLVPFSFKQKQSQKIQKQTTKMKV